MDNKTVIDSKYGGGGGGGGVKEKCYLVGREVVSRGKERIYN